ncbi:PEP-CTERM motif protein [Stieleria neptunia]|uniref:PEP-CTERM motif protein n=1 Tax=Stieleria neptunia TaxID=2527979 RepID=A0A518I0C2_9BACT|nr:PEP-CTERM sorting domain-containing protein [Stieleria neptunia]QDV46566.1 PEP-CTERM motif protein [Stieleria neptunia]
MRKRLTVLALGLSLIWSSQQLSAGTIFSQGFETDTNGWFDESSTWTGSLQQVSSGTNGIASSSGSFHATASQTTTPGPGLSGPFSNFADSNSDTAWPGGIRVAVDIYLDTSWAFGEGFDYSTAMSSSSGAHQQDFIFHVTKDTSTGDLLVGGSNNTNFDPREDLETLNHFVVTSSGWYTFEHIFREESGDLFADLNLLDSSGSLLFTETRTGGDPIATTGGARYSWFTNIDINGGIAIDNHVLQHVPEPSSFAIFATGLMGLALRRPRQRKNA